MKKIVKKITIISLIICIFVSLFNIGKVLAEEPKFILTDASISDKSDGVEATITSFDSESIVTESTYHKLNDYVDYQLTIKNNDSNKYKLISVSDNSSNDYLDYEYNYNKDEYISPNNTIKVNMKSIYENELEDLNNREQTDEFIISLVFEDEEGNIDNRTIIVNPDTHTIGGVSIYTYILIISICLLLLILIPSKKKKKVLLVSLILMPFIAKAIEPSLTINFTNNATIMDKVIIYKDVNGEITSEIINYNSKLEVPETPIIEGYDFIGWYQGEEPFDFDKELTEDISITAKFSPIIYSITYNLNGGTVTSNPDSYTIETESFDLNNPTKEGYSFSGWTGSNGDELQTRVTIERGSTGDKTYTANYSPNQETHYKVNHKYTKLDEGYEVEVEYLYGTTGSSVTPAFRSKEGFVNPTPQEITITADGNAELDYIYEREKYQLTINNIEDVETTFENKKYPFETVITMTAKDKDHYDFVKWSNGVTTKELSFAITEDTTIGPEYTPKEYTVTFDVQGGVEVNPITKTYNSEIGELPEGIRQNYKFDGWFTEAEGGEKITENTKVLDNVTYYAHWTPIVCRTAATLHMEECTRTSDGCHQAGYYNEGIKNTSTIVYGTIPSTDTLTAGYAYDCDVNGDGTFDSNTERFYYLRTNGNNAVLISHNHFEGENGQQAINNFDYDSIYSQLPSSDQWSNNLLVITNDKPARIPTYDELKEACGKNNLTQNGDLDGCIYLLENTRFSNTTLSQDGTWLEKIGNTKYRYHSVKRAVTSNTQVNAVRPVIEVPLDNMDETYYESLKRTITFDAQGGTEVESITIDAYTIIGTLPTTTKEEYYFDGWYTEVDGGTKIIENTIISDDITLYAHWKINDVFEVNGTNYPTLDIALEHVPTDGTLTTIKLLRDFSDEATILEGQNVILDLQEYTLSNKTDDSVISNGGTLKIYNGTITTTGEIAAAINNEATGHLIITGGQIIGAGVKQAVYNRNGIIEIRENAYIKGTSTQRAALQNLESGTIYITGGTIISEGYQGLNNAGTLIIGTEDGTHNIDTPVIQGKTYGLNTTTPISMYDGILKGKTNAINNRENIVNFEQNHTLITGTEGSYKTLYFESN